MAQHIPFKGIKRVLSSSTAYTQTDSFLYFVRESAQAASGDIWFMGHHYGHFGEHDLDIINTALDGFLGDTTANTTNVKDYIDEAVSAITSGMTTSVELDPDAFSGLTIEDKSATPNVKDYVINLQNVAREDLFEKEIQDRAEADEALQTALEATAQTLSDAIEAEEQAREAADNNLQDQIDELSGSTDDLQAEVDRIETAVGLNSDGTYVADDGQYVSAATSVLDATAKLNDALVQEVVDRNQAIEDAIEALIGDASESGNTLGELEDRIEELSADAKEYHLVKTTTGLPEAIKERYSLVDADGNVSGDTVDIPKDSHIVSITYITTSGDPHYQNLEYVYIDASGNTQTVYVDMSELVLESEFASGVTAIDGVVRGVVDPTSETFLTVGAAGFKLSGVQDAIDTAVDAEEEARKEADSAITEDLETTAATLVQMIEDAKKAATTKVVEGEDNEHLAIASAISPSDSSVTYTITLTDVASASALTKEISDREAADAAIQAELDAVESSLGFDGTGYTQAEKVYISGNTVAQDIALLDAALSKVEDSFTDALQEEIDNRASADTAIRESLAETAATLTDMIEDETSARTAADNALDARLDVVEEKYLTGATVNGVVATVTDHVAAVTIDAGDIELGEEVTGATGGIHFDATANTQDVFQSIVDTLNRSVAGSYTGLTTSDSAITLTDQTNGQNIALKREAATVSTAQDGHIEIKESEAQGHEGELYGVMYWIDEETA